MVPVQMMSTNAVMDNASLCSMPVMIMMTVETSQMSLAAVSNFNKEHFTVSLWNKKERSVTLTLIVVKVKVNKAIYRK